MMNTAKLGGIPLFAIPRRGSGITTIVLAALLVMPALALAHGGMGPDEIGPPIVTSGLLGFVGYWVVMFWPTIKKKDEQDEVDKQNRYAPQSVRRPHGRSANVKRIPRLRKIEGTGQFRSDENVRRKASDG
ncbi:MAG: hypothetical protein AB7G75_32660 [Candidatus Binatia bacterium]